MRRVTLKVLSTSGHVRWASNPSNSKPSPSTPSSSTPINPWPKSSSSSSITPSTSQTDATLNSTPNLKNTAPEESLSENKNVNGQAKGTSPSEKQKNLANYNEYCLNLVKEVDYPGYYTSLFLPRRARQAAFAIRAFNFEIASVKSIVSRPDLGEMRMSWWKEAINAAYAADPPEHPVAFALTEAIHSCDLTRTFFTKIINERLKDLRIKQPRSLSDMERYAEETASSILYLTLEALSVKDTNADHAASHLGQSIGLMTLLRGIRHQIRSGDVYLPMDLTLKIIRGDFDEKACDVVFEVANSARHHLEWSRKLLNDVPKEARPALLQSAFVEDYLDKLQKVNFNPMAPEVAEFSPLRPRLRVAVNYYTGRY